MNENETEEKMIGKKYAFSYANLDSVYFISDTYHPFQQNYQAKHNYTIIEYLGNHLYRDLTTDMIFQDQERNILDDIFFLREGDRIDYSVIDQEEFDFVLEYPFRILPDSIKIITDDLLVDIWNNTYLNRENLIGFLNKQKEKIVSQYQELKDAIVEEEVEGQYQSALQEMNDDFAFRKREHDLEEARKVYQLK